MGSGLSWPDIGLREGGFLIFGRPDDGLGEDFWEGGWSKNFRGAQALFFFLEKFYLLKFFFFGPRGGPGPLSLLPGSVPACILRSLVANLYYARD